MLVHLSRLIDDSYRTNPSSLLSPESTWAEQQRKVWVSIGALPLLRVGDIWRDGRFELAPDYEIEQFDRVEINTDTSVLIKAGLNLEDKGFLLPRAEHPWHMQCTQSYCLMVTLSNGRRLIIPCMELIRFYFGSSSNLLSKLFLPPLTQDSLYGNGYYRQLSGRLTLELAAGISGASAADVGRIFMDDTAWRAALHVGTSLLRASTSGQPAYPQAFFPFEGKTNLIASGKWLCFGDELRATFLVYSLRSCSHSFPFKSLRYRLAAKCAPGGPGQPTGPSDFAKPAVRRQAAKGTGEALVENDASSRLAKQTRSVWNAARFPDLATKTIWKSRALSGPSGESMNAGVAAAVTQVAVGNPGSEKRVRSIDLQIRVKRHSLLPEPEFLKEVVKELIGLEGCAVELLTDSEDDGWTIPMALVADEEGEIDSRIFVENGPDQFRERRIAVFAISKHLSRIFLVAIEDASVYVKLYPASESSVGELWKTSKAAANDFVAKRDSSKADIGKLVLQAFI